jgi:hypothetical protein
MSGPSFEGTPAVSTSGESWPMPVAEPPAAEPAGKVAESKSAESKVAESADDVARLEELLVERARQLQDQRAALQRTQQLLRAATAGFERTLASVPDPARLEQQRVAAVTRAIEAEAARAELAFRLDELRGHAVTGTEPGTRAAPAPSGETPEAACARLEGTVHGLSSLLSETEEARDVASARLVLAEQDLALLRARGRDLERELAELREQLELEAMRARGLSQQLEGTLSAREAAELRGELAGACARRDEGERVAEGLLAALDAARESERTARADNERAAAQIQALKHGLEQETKTAREAADKLAHALAESAVLRGQLAAAGAAAPAPEPKRDEQLEAEHGAAQRHAAEQRIRADRFRDALREARHVLGELAGSLERSVSTIPPVPKAPHDDAGASEHPTQPGMPTYIEAMEGLEELVALRDEHIRDLTTKLQLERDRTRAIERGLRALEQSAAGALPAGPWAELLALVQSAHAQR